MAGFSQNPKNGLSKLQLPLETKGLRVDGDVKQYPNTIRNVIKRYPEAKVVIANHSTSPMGDFGLLKYTLQLAEAQLIKAK